MQAERRPIQQQLFEQALQVPLSRRRFLLIGGLAFGTALVAACGGDDSQEVGAFNNRADNSDRPVATVTSEGLVNTATPTVSPDTTVAPPRAGGDGGGVTAVPPAVQEVKKTPRDLMPVAVLKIYDDIIRLNQGGVFKDATTGGPLSEEDLKKAFLEPLERAVIYESGNRIEEAFYRYNQLLSILSPLRAQLFATGGDTRIQSVGAALTLFIKETFPAGFGQDVQSGVFSEFLPK